MNTNDLKLPEELQYLRPVVRTLPEELLDEPGLEAYLAALEPPQREALIHAYEETDRRKTDARISEYLYGVDAMMHDPVYVALKNLERFFAALAKRDVAPFNSGRVAISKPPPGKPDWSVLPEELRYVGPYAERYGLWTYPAEIDAALARLSDEERAELTEFGKRFAPDRRKLERWSSELLLRGFQGRTAATLRPLDAASFAEQERSLTIGLKVFLLQGGFIPKSKSPGAAALRRMREDPDDKS